MPGFCEYSDVTPHSFKIEIYRAFFPFWVCLTIAWSLSYYVTTCKFSRKSLRAPAKFIPLQGIPKRAYPVQP